MCWPMPSSCVQLSGEAYQALYEQDGAVAERPRPPSGSAWPTSPRSTRAPQPTSTPRGRSSRSSRTWRSSSATTPTASTPRPGACRTSRIASALLDRLKRKYGPTLDDVIAHAATVRSASSRRWQSSDERAAEVDRELRRRRGRVPASAPKRCRPGATGQPRRGSPADLIAVAGGLAMERLRFEVRFEASAAPGHGARKDSTSQSSLCRQTQARICVLWRASSPAGNCRA